MTYERMAKFRAVFVAPEFREAMQDAREEIASTFENTVVHVDGSSIDGNVIAEDIRNHRFSWEKDHA
jgi:hypothetical protein